MLKFIVLVCVLVHKGQGNPCQNGETFQCQDGSTPSGTPPCSTGKPQCCSSGQCSDAPPPGQNNQNNNQNNQNGKTCSNPTCSNPPCKANLLGDVGCTIVAGTTKYDHELTKKSDAIATNAHIYGPFEAGFTSKQQSIIESWGCSDPSQVYDSAGGLDLQIAEEKVALTCNMEFPRIMGDVYKGIVGECGGHTMDYHFHVRLSCLYTPSGGHSPQLGVVGPSKLYGKWEDYSNNLLPLLDACGAHFGYTPDSPSTMVYHYHVQDNPPFTVGCYGPAAGNQLVGVAACRALYSECDKDGGSGTTLHIKKNGVQQTVTYDRFCPCYDATGSNMGNNIQELPALSSSVNYYTAGTTTSGSVASSTTGATSTTASTTTSSTTTSTATTASTTTSSTTTSTDGPTTSGPTTSSTTTSIVTTTTLVEVHATITGSLNMDVPDADSFLSDNSAQDAVKEGIGQALDVPTGYIQLSLTKLGRRLGAHLSGDRKLAGVSVKIDYTVNIPTSAANTMATVTSNMNSVSTQSLQSAIVSKVAAAKGNSYTVAVASSTSPSITLATSTSTAPTTVTVTQAKASPSQSGSTQTDSASSALPLMVLALLICVSSD